MNPPWNWCRVHGTRFYRVWRRWPHSDPGTMHGIEQYAAVVDDFGNLVNVEQGPTLT